MPANVETMFSVRETPWHGLGRIIMDAPASREALELAGLDWQVESRNIYSGTDRKSTRLNSSHVRTSRMPSSA